MPSIGNLDSLRWFAPELVLGAGALALFILDLLARGQRRAGVLLGGTLVVLAASGLLLWQEPPDRALLFGGMIAHDGLRSWFGWLFLAAAGVAVLTAHGSRQVDVPRRGDFYALLLSVTFGLFLLASATDILMLYLALEAVSLPSYALAGLRRHNRESSEAALKYVIYGGVASGLLLYGLSLFYGLFGTTHLVGPGSIATLIAQGNALAAPPAKLAFGLGVVFVLAGVGFKISAAPFHQWAPDVYEGSPTPFALFLSIGPKTAGFALVIRLLWTVLGASGHGGPNGPLDWSLLLGVLAAATMTAGNLAALAQKNLKRLLAWSSIAHAGYLLLGLAAANLAGMRAVLVYAAVYVVMNAGAFAAVSMISDATGGEQVEDARGLFKRAPLLALTFTIFLFGLTGLPPFAGFPGKIMLFGALVERGGGLGYGLAVAGVLYSALSLFFYARVIKAMAFEKARDESPLPSPALHQTVLSGLAVLTLFFGLWWSPLAGFAALALPR